MFDPLDYPYKDIEGDTYDPDDMFTNTSVSGDNKQDSNSSKSLDDVSLAAANTEPQILFQTNDSGRYFNTETTILSDNSINQNTELFIAQSENFFNSEPTLLDENTVNQFLLPFQDSSEKQKESSCTDILALHSCIVCHEIFTKEADLLDHAISVHASNNLDQNQNNLPPISDVVVASTEEANDVNYETEWLVCGICERVLSTALEIEPTEQLCCIGIDCKTNVISRKLLTMYVCDYCSSLFADGDALDKHRLICFVEESKNYYTEEMVDCNELTNAPEQPEVCYSCDICRKQYSCMADLKIHSRECLRNTKSARRPYTNSSSNKMWNCGSCNQLFATARELYRHKRGEDRPQGAPLTAYVCEECDKILGSMCALHTHKKMHKVTKPGYPCRVCGRRFNQSGHLAIHMRMHTGERPYPCDLCPKAFKVKVERDDHRRTHTGERPFACTACPKTFTAAARLREHARIHTDQRPYRCEICGAAFRRPYARTVHTLIHTGEKPHECDVCGTAFRRSGDMWKHKRTLHGIQANFDVDLYKA